MRAYLPAYDVQVPANLKEALERLSREPGEWRPLAGGTDLMVVLETGRLEHKKFLSLQNCQELKGVEVRPDCVLIGALTTFTEIHHNAVLAKEFPMLAQAARETGALAIQNRGTIGGNIANASPAADSPPALLAYDALLELTCQSGSRWVEYKDFHTAYKKMLLKPEELLTRVKLMRRTAPSVQYYRKVGTRAAQSISKVCIAATAEIRGGAFQDLRITFGSVAPTVIRCSKTEALLRSQRVSAAKEAAFLSKVRETVLAEVTPIDDIRSSRDYRSTVSANLVEEFLRKCIEH